MNIDSALSVIGVLHRINHEFGIGIWKTPSKAISIYRDYAPKELAQVKLLKDFCNVGACKILISAISGTTEDHVDAYYKAVNIMCSNCLYSREVIESFCYDFSIAAGSKLPGVTINVESEKLSAISSKTTYSHQHTNGVSPKSRTTKLLYCRVCGKPVADDAYVCPHCGTPNYKYPNTTMNEDQISICGYKKLYIQLFGEYLSEDDMRFTHAWIKHCTNSSIKKRVTVHSREEIIPSGKYFYQIGYYDRLFEKGEIIVRGSEKEIVFQVYMNPKGAICHVSVCIK